MEKDLTTGRRPRAGGHLRPGPWAPGRAVAAAALAAVAAAWGLSGCGGAKAAAATGAVRPHLTVVASAYPLAQLAAYIGGSGATVVDLAAPGVAPQGLTLSAAQRARVREAGLFLYVGDGYQPAVEAVAATARHRLAVLPAVSRTSLPYEFWLDPVLMGRAASAVARAMSAADPPGSSRFAAGGRDFQSVASSVGSDYVNSLSTCSGHVFMTTDDAFARLAARYSLQDLSVQSLGTAKAKDLVASDHLGSVFTEEGVGAGALQEVAVQSGATVKTLNPMEVAPTSGTARTDSWFSVMEQDLDALEGGLGCDTSELFG